MVTMKVMPHVALWEPEIPPNTGNIARLCAATGTPLHLIGRLGFRLDDRSLRRAGLDYWPDVDVHRHADFVSFTETVQGVHGRARVLCFSAHAVTPYTDIAFEAGDVLLFGGETRGLPDDILAKFAASTFCLPMPSGKVRSLNLAVAVGIVLYEALRQLHAW